METLISRQGLLNVFTSEPILNLHMRMTYLIKAEPIESVGFGNTLLVAQLRLKSGLEKPQIKFNQRDSL